MVLNVIVADALDEICTDLEEAVGAGTTLEEALQERLTDLVRRHRRILFNGDNYSERWENEARKRGLPNLKATPEALEAMVDEPAIGIFVRHGVMSDREIRSRYETYRKAYHETVTIEASCALHMAKTLIVPAAIRYEGDLAECISKVASVRLSDVLMNKKLLADFSARTEELLEAVEALEACVGTEDAGKKIAAMAGLRKAADAIEGTVPADLWTLPSYADMMFMS
jgi:glutamine synthetase